MDKKLATLSLSSTTEAGRNSPSVDTESEKANRRLQVPDRLKFQVDGVEGTVVGEVKLAPSPSPSPPVEDKFDALVRWLAENGTKFPDLYLKKYAPAVRGVHAHRDIGPYKPILQVPLSCLITDKMGRNCEFGSRVFANSPALAYLTLLPACCSC